MQVFSKHLTKTVLLGGVFVFVFLAFFLYNKNLIPSAYAFDNCGQCIDWCDTHQYESDGSFSSWEHCVGFSGGCQSNYPCSPEDDDRIGAGDPGPPPETTTTTTTTTTTPPSTTGGGGAGSVLGGLFKDCQKDPDGWGKRSISCVIQNSINSLVKVAGALIIVIIVIAGIMYIVSAGNPTTTTLAKKTLVGAIIGLIIVVLSYTMIALMIQLLK